MRIPCKGPGIGLLLAEEVERMALYDLAQDEEFPQEFGLAGDLHAQRLFNSLDCDNPVGGGAYCAYAAHYHGDVLIAPAPYQCLEEPGALEYLHPDVNDRLSVDLYPYSPVPLHPVEVTQGHRSQFWRDESMKVVGR